MRRATDRLSQLSSDPTLQMLARKREDDIWLTELGRRRGVEAARTEGREEGREEGRAVVRAAIFGLLEAKFGTVSEATRARVASASSTTLARVLGQAATATSLEELDFSPG